MSIRAKKTVSIFVRNSEAKELNVYKTVKCILDIANGDFFEAYIYIDKKYTTILHKLKNEHIVFYDPKKFKFSEIKTEYLCLIKAGNLVTREWFENATNLLSVKEKENAILLPEAEFSFGYDQEQMISRYHNENLKLVQLGKLIHGEGAFKELLFCKKNIMTRLAKTPLDLEDVYKFNLEIFRNAIPIYIIPDTIVFARKPNAAERIKENLLDSSLLSDINKSVAKIVSSSPQKTAKKTSPPPKKSLYARFRDQKIVILGVAVVKKTVSLFSDKLENRASRRIPKAFRDSWKCINYIESSLYPDTGYAGHIPINEISPDYAFLRAYCNLTEKINSHSIKYIFFVPWVVRGGGDKVLINYLKAFMEKHPDWYIAVVATQPSKNEWAEFLPKNAIFIDFEKEADGFSELEQEMLFSRLIAATQCRNLHIINSAYAFDWMVKNNEALEKSRFTINASSFCYDYVPGTNYEWQVEFADPYLVEGYDLINHIYTDNKATIAFDAEKNGFDPKKSTVHYQPITEKYIKPKKITAGKKLRILWASRIAEQKLPFVLYEIGKKLDNSIASIDVYGYFYDDLPKRMFNKVKTISYKGQFDGLHNIKIEDYDLFLYTSIIDGVPNIVLEAIAAGLPVIASNSGGISEVVRHEKTGLLVDDVMNPEGYIKAIKEVKDNPEAAEEYAKEAQSLLKTQHSWEGFVSKVEKDIIDVIE